MQLILLNVLKRLLFWTLMLDNKCLFFVDSFRCPIFIEKKVDCLPVYVGSRYIISSDIRTIYQLGQLFSSYSDQMDAYCYFDFQLISKKCNIQIQELKFIVVEKITNLVTSCFPCTFGKLWVKFDKIKQKSPIVWLLIEMYIYFP